MLATNLSGAESSLLVGGLRLGELYTVTLSCGFGPRQFECGRVAVSTAPPHLVTAARVYSLASVARTWAGAEAECVAGGGHLVSLATPGEERRVLETLGGRDIWTGGNMCPDSPGRREGGSRPHVTTPLQRPAAACGLTAARTSTPTSPRTPGWRATTAASRPGPAAGAARPATSCCTACARHVYHHTASPYLTNLIQARVSRVLAHAPQLSLTSGRGLLAVRWVGRCIFQLYLYLQREVLIK